jgi:hypothetical protein
MLTIGDLIRSVCDASVRSGPSALVRLAVKSHAITVRGPRRFSIS